MLNFIVLGYVPGTSIQISFTGYLLILAGFVLLSWLIGRLLSYILRSTLSHGATCMYPYLKFRRRADTFTVKLKLG